MNSETRKYKVSVDCASCRNNIELAFKPYPEISWNLNIVTQVLKVSFEVNKYSDEFIIQLIKKAGYDIERF